MRRRGIIGSILLIGAGVVLGTTVFRNDIAQATGLAQGVTVANTSANPVPVQEQNKDANGFIKTHEQGTADVNVTNSALPVANVNDGQNPFSSSVTFGLPAHTTSYEVAGATIPDGKTFVEEFVSAHLAVPTGTTLISAAAGHNSTIGAYLVPVKIGSNSQFDYYHVSGLVRDYIAAGEHLTFFLITSDEANSGSAFFVANGYLVNTS
jgi:hypothetical protein